MKMIQTALLAALMLLAMACGTTEEGGDVDCNGGGFVSCGDEGDDDNNDTDDDDDDDDNNDVDDGNNDVDEPPVETCSYPTDFFVRPALNYALPPMTFNKVYDIEGNADSLSLEQIMCDEEFEDIETIVFIFSATWCPNCPGYAQYLQTFLDDMREEGALMIWVKVQNDDFEPATTDTALASFGRYFLNDNAGVYGYFVGDANIEGASFNNTPLVNAFPSQMVVRKRDMKVIGASATYDFLLPILQMARYPEADWRDAANNVLDTQIGTACGRDADCDTGTLIPYCFAEIDQNQMRTGWDDGYCTGLTCADDAACGEGNVCAQIDANGLTACFKSCDPEAAETGCRENYACQPLAGPGSPAACTPPTEE